MDTLNLITMENKLYNLEQIELMSEGNDEFVDKMVNLFIELTPELLNRINAGLIENDYDEIKSAAHKMKPSIDMMGIVSLKTEIRNVEKLALDRVDALTMKTAIVYIETTLEKVINQLRER